ncbi:MAG: MSMEG_4193 family putative phosphomutase [Nocardioides sp.]
MATLVLVRHARSTANVSGVLTGRLPGVHLDDTGREQSVKVGERLAPVPLAAIVSSPLERCRETAKGLAAAQAAPPRITAERGLVECDYGEWEGRKLGELARLKLWKAVQRHPAGVTFPGGESMADMSARAVSAVRRHDSRVQHAAGQHAVWAAVTHGDLVKAILADALGLHLDQFQRIHVDPASVSVVRYTPEAAFVIQTNTHAGDLSWLAPRGKGKAPRTGVVGGGAGPGAARRAAGGGI